MTASCATTAKGHLPSRSLTMEAKMGRNRVVVATLLVHSVNTATSRERIKVMAAGGTECKGSICFPIHSDSPEAWEVGEDSHRGPERPWSFPRELSPSCALTLPIPTSMSPQPVSSPASLRTEFWLGVTLTSQPELILSGPGSAPWGSPSTCCPTWGAGCHPVGPVMPTRPPGHPERLPTAQAPAVPNAQERDPTGN